MGRAGYGMEWKILVWNAELLKYGMEWKISLIEWKESSILVYLNVVFISIAVNEATFDQTHETIKEKSSSQRFIE